MIGVDDTGNVYVGPRAILTTFTRVDELFWADNGDRFRETFGFQ